jgi:hypothetical protein
MSRSQSLIVSSLNESIFQKLPLDELIILRNEMEGMVADSEAQDARLAECVDHVKIMIFTAEIMENLMMDLLDLAQMENNTFKMNKAFFSIFEAIE